MTESSSPQSADRHLVAEIVRGYLVKNTVAVDQVGGLIAVVHQTLSGLGSNATMAAPIPEKLTPAVPIRRSVQPEHVVCLECGFRAITLRRHLRVAHGLTPAAYRVRWTLATDHPLTAPAYSERRSMMAKERGLGRKLSVAERGDAPARQRRSRAVADEQRRTRVSE